MPDTPSIDPETATEAASAPRRARPVSRNVLLSVLSLVAGGLVYWALPEDVGEAGRRMAFIFTVALVLWVTEAVPLFATSLFVILAEVWLLAVPADLPGRIAYDDVFQSLGNPIIFLFLGGFMLARGLQSQGIDLQLATLLLRPFGTRPGGVLAGVMLITAAFSMWMSNTATTALMIALVAPLARRLPHDEPFRRGLILGIPFSANIGGIGTPIGTPPNAIALGELAGRGYSVNFLQWMLCAVPLLLGMLVIIWALIMVLCRPRMKHVSLDAKADFGITRERVIVYACFWLTTGLWITSPLHGIPNAVVAVIPAALLPLTRIIDREGFNSLEWDVLILIAGGIALGSGMRLTGLDLWLIGLLPLSTLPFAVILFLSVALAVALSTVMSSTVAANIMVPLALTAASLAGASSDPRVVAMLVAIATSFAMALPISTPPNAIAYGSGMLNSRDMLRVGTLISVAGALIVGLTGPYMLRLVLAWI